MAGSYLVIAAPPAGWDAAYQTLVKGGAYNAVGTPRTITLNGLTVGQDYSVQIFEAFWNYNWATAFSDGTDSSSPLNLAGLDPTGLGYPTPGIGTAAVPQYVLGSFTADATSETIYMTSPTPDVIFDALQVRTGLVAAPMPEPPTLAIIVASLIALSAARHATKTRGG